jgi:hypothetical protein
MTTKAAVTRFVLANPRGQLCFDIKNDKGEVENWGVGSNRPGNLICIGWTKNTFEPGE